MSSGRSLRWTESDPRDIEAHWGEFSLRVKAEQRGTVWASYVKGPGVDFRSEHVSKDAAKQRAAKVCRQAARDSTGE